MSGSTEQDTYVDFPGVHPIHNLTSLITSCVLYGLTTVLLIFLIRDFRSPRFSSAVESIQRGAAIAFVITTFYLISTVTFFAFSKSSVPNSATAHVKLNIWVKFPKPPKDEVLRRSNPDHDGLDVEGNPGDSVRYAVVRLWTGKFIPIFADRILFHVTHELYRNNRGSRFLKLSFFLVGLVFSATIGTTLSCLIKASTLDPTKDRVTMALYISSWILSLGTKALLIGIIMFRLWETRNTWSLGAGWRSRTLNAMSMATETGTIYFVHQLVTLILLYTHPVFASPRHWFTLFMFESHIYTTAMYPIIVLLLMSWQRSIMNFSF